MLTYMHYLVLLRDIKKAIKNEKKKNQVKRVITKPKN